MLQRRGNSVDVEALHDRIPLRQDAGKGPRWDLMGTEGCGGGKVVSWLPSKVLGCLSIYIGGRSRSGGHRGAHKVGGHALNPCGRLVALLTCTPSLLGVFWSKKNHRESFIPFGLRLIFLFCETLKQGKTGTGTGL